MMLDLRMTRIGPCRDINQGFSATALVTIEALGNTPIILTACFPRAHELAASAIQTHWKKQEV